MAAAPAFVTGASSTFSLTVTKPSGTIAGDLLVMSVVTYDTSPVSVTCTGWTRRINNVLGTKNGGADGKIYLTVLERVADGSEGASFTVSMTGTPYTDIMCARYNGIIAGPYDTSASDSTVNATTTASAPSVTTSVANELLIVVHAGYNTPGLSGAYSGFSTDIGPNDSVNYMFSKAQATAGTVGPFTQTQSSTSYVTATLAYKPGVNFDVAATATAISEQSGSPKTITTSSFTVSSSATYAILVVEASLSGGNSDSNISITSAAVGGQAATAISGSLKHSGTDGTTSGYVQLFGVANPPTGSQTASATATVGVGGSVICLMLHVVTVTGPVASLGTAVVNNGHLVSTLAVTDTLSVGDILIGGCVNGAASPGVNSGNSVATTTGTVVTASHGGLRSMWQAGSGSRSLSWAPNSGNDSAASAVRIIAGTPSPVFIAPRPELVSQAMKRSSYF